MKSNPLLGILLVLCGFVFAACASRSPETRDDLQGQPREQEGEAPTGVLERDLEAQEPGSSSPEDQPLSTTPLPPYPLDEMEEADSGLIRGEVQLERRELVVHETERLVDLSLSGMLPNPCYQLRVVVQDPDDQFRVDVEVYGVAAPDQICAQVLEPFEDQIDITPPSPGEYTIWVNGVEVGGFNLTFSRVYP